MRINKAVIAPLFVLFFGLNITAVALAGWSGVEDFFRQANWWTVVGLTDLYICLGLVSYWIWSDAKRRGVSPWPYIVLTMGTGSIGSLLYLLTRPRERSEETPAKPRTEKVAATVNG